MRTWVSDTASCIFLGRCGVCSSSMMIPALSSSRAAIPSPTERGVGTPVAVPSTRQSSDRQVRLSTTSPSKRPAQTFRILAISSITSANVESVPPDLPILASTEARNSLGRKGSDRKYCWIGLDTASEMACLIVDIVTLGPFSRAAPGDFLPRAPPSPCGSLVAPSFSTSSTALLQISRARRASPLTEAIFMLANLTASASTMLPGTPSSLDWMIRMSCSWLYPGKAIRVKPGARS